jgi:ferritin-like metal-binding protein YciE
MEPTLISGTSGNKAFEEAIWQRKLFAEQLNEVYCIEKTLTKTIPQLIRRVSSEELADALVSHFAISKNHLKRLEQIFSSLNEKVMEEKYLALNDLIKETESVLKDAQTGLSLDVGILLAGQKAEQYEIEAYKSLYSLAKTLDEHIIAALLEKTLSEEIEANEKLERIAHSLTS